MEEFHLETKEVERWLAENPQEDDGSEFNINEAFIEMISVYHDGGSKTTSAA